MTHILIHTTYVLLDGIDKLILGYLERNNEKYNLISNHRILAYWF